MKMNNFKLIIFAILLSGFNSSPITKDTPMKNQSADYDKCLNNVTSQCRKLQKYGGYSIMRQNVCEGDMFTCIDMHKNSKMRHSISPRKLDRVFANSKMRHLKCSKILK